MKRMLSRALTVLFLISLSLPAAAAADASPFTDVSPDDYFYSPVLWAVGGDITQGVGDGKFAPCTTCTRSQVVTFLWRAMGKTEPGTPSPVSGRFPDNLDQPAFAHLSGEQIHAGFLAPEHGFRVHHDTRPQALSLLPCSLSDVERP